MSLKYQELQGVLGMKSALKDFKDIAYELPGTLNT